MAMPIESLICLYIIHRNLLNDSYYEAMTSNGCSNAVSVDMSIIKHCANNYLKLSLNMLFVIEH